MEGQHLEQKEENGESGILAVARDHILNYYNQHPDTRLVFHNYRLTVAIVEKCKTFCVEEGLSLEQIQTAKLAAYFLNTGYLTNYEQPAAASIQMADNFLNNHLEIAPQKPTILSAIKGVFQGNPSDSVEGRILFDAHSVCACIDGFPESNPLLRLERELILNEDISKLDWAKLQLQQLLTLGLQTHSGRVQYESILAQHIFSQKELVESLGSKQVIEYDDEGGIEHKYRQIERKVPSRGIQTFFRTNYRNHINLSAIADNKANIMISVNSILISVLITFLSYRNIGTNNPTILLPVVIFLVTGLASLTFAILSARPKVTMLNKDDSSREKVRKNVIFFGNFVTLNLDQFEEAMDSLFNDGELLYGNMTRDLYYLGKVLDKKYRYLAISYNIFMIGFLATVGTFLFLLF